MTATTMRTTTIAMMIQVSVVPVMFPFLPLGRVRVSSASVSRQPDEYGRGKPLARRERVRYLRVKVRSAPDAGGGLARGGKSGCRGPVMHPFGRLGQIVGHVHLGEQLLQWHDPAA